MKALIVLLTSVFVTLSVAFGQQTGPSTDQQRAAFRNCMDASAAVYKLVDKMAAPGTRWYVDRKKFLKDQDELRAKVAEMSRRHRAFLTSLTSDQIAVIDARLAKLDRIQADLEERLQGIDDQLASSDPNGRQVWVNAYHLRNDIGTWRKEHKKLAKETGVDAQLMEGPGYQRFDPK